MGFDRRFKFHDAGMQQQLRNLMRRADVKHSVDADGTVCFSSSDEQGFDDAAVEVRDAAFGPHQWHVCMCELNEVPKYLEHINGNGIQYVQESNDDEPWFLLGRQHDPEQWGIW